MSSLPGDGIYLCFVLLLWPKALFCLYFLPDIHLAQTFSLIQ